MLAKAITTLDHLSNGRAAIGIGAGWADLEYRAFGIDFPSAGVRLDQLEEGVAIVRRPRARRSRARQSRSKLRVCRR